jgi:hypothetical protein
MNTTLIIVLVTGALLYNTYHENFLFKTFDTYKKYYKMAAIVVAALGFYIIMNKNPMKGYSTMQAAQQYINVLPMDKNSKDFFKPFMGITPEEKAVQRILTAGKSNKRSVSETKKKFVASNQNWKCNDCKDQLKAWFEVDHIQRLDQGGSNDVDNLVALCRNCHGKKTSMENI